MSKSNSINEELEKLGYRLSEDEPTTKQVGSGSYQNTTRATWKRKTFKNTPTHLFEQGSYYRASQRPTIINTRPVDMQNLRIVDNTKYMIGDELVLPKEIARLIDDKRFIPRHKKLARDYGMKYLLKLAELAKTKAKPSRWYAVATSVKNWGETTEKMLIDLLKKTDKLIEKLKGLGIDSKYYPYYLKAMGILSENKFDKAVRNANSRGVNSPPRLLAAAIRENIKELFGNEATPAYEQ